MDSESKVVEIVIENFRLALGDSVDKYDGTEQLYNYLARTGLLQMAHVSITLTSEMDFCPHCRSVISTAVREGIINLNQSTHGTRYEQNNY